MADSKISALTALTETPADDDVFAVVDTSATATKKITFATLNAAVSATVAADDIGIGNAAVSIATSAGNITIDAQAGDTDIIFKGTDNTSDITALTLDMSEAGAATFNDKITAVGTSVFTNLDISGDVDIDGTLEADAITIGSTAIGSIYSAIAGSSSIVTTGALNSGSITSGFGAIDNGSSAITTTGTVNYGSLSDGSITITAFVDEDNMASNSATLVPTQQSIKAYVDSVKIYELTKTANYTAVAGDNILADTSGGAFTITLPGSPTAGNTIHILDAAASFDNNNLTVARNGKKIQGATNDLTITTENTGIGLVFYNDTYGWRILVDAYDVDPTEL